ncbi:DEAD/DEAH box helicase, partial [uncultured Agrococcus sp.]|uniref:DEAD/DEAH box helicase n=1 Tax=uncultured Agrococcus sp. TaxID=382258 RepID=UPI0025E14568
LLLPQAQFLLMSATLGDTERIREDLSERTGRATELVAGAVRPVPLEFEWVTSPVHETVERLVEEHESPVYIVHFSQAQAVERAQALTSLRVATKEQKDDIARAIGDFRFTTTFGRALSRYVRAGIGVHHAGMLPRYRRLVEVLAQRGLLRVICGTDTLGVGINVPIRSVLFTALSKFDGTRMRHLSAREYHQIAGRAGRAGYDDHGLIVVQAPDHVTEYEQAVKKAEGDAKKQKKIKRKSPPQGFVNWTEATFQRLNEAEPEPLESHFAITSAMLINLIARGGDVVKNTRELIFDSYETPTRKFALARRAIGIFRTLVHGEIVVIDRQHPLPGTDRPSIRLAVELQPDFALNQPLSPFALAAITVFDPEGGSDSVGSGDYALDVLSVIEATLDDPRPVLFQQQNKARGDAIAEMKADGVEYEERMERLESITHPKPLAELLDQLFDDFAEHQPWVRDWELRPKSVVRDMIERGLNFADYVSFNELARSEGVLLRYLSDAYRALDRTVTTELKTEELESLIEWLGVTVRQVDSSLVDEWESLIAPTGDDGEPSLPEIPRGITEQPKAFTVLVRNALWRRVQLAALQRDAELEALDPDVRWPDALDQYYDEHDSIGVDADARSPRLCLIDSSDAAVAEGVWRVEQIIADPDGNHDWRIRATVDLAASDETGDAVLRVHDVVRL